MLTPEKDWQDVINEFEGKDTTPTTLKDVVEASPQNRVYYKDFIKHLNEQQVDLGFKLGKASTKVAKMLTDLLSVEVEAFTDTHKGRYLSNVGLKFPKVEISFDRPAEVNEVIMKARYDRIEHYKKLGIDDREAVDRAEGNYELITQRMLQEEREIDKLRKTVSETRASILKSPWLKYTCSELPFKTALTRAIIDCDSIFHPLRETEMYDTTTIGDVFPATSYERALSGCTKYYRYISCEYWGITDDQLTHLLEVNDKKKISDLNQAVFKNEIDISYLLPEGTTQKINSLYSKNKKALKESK